MANENTDKIYGILRDVKNNVITVEDGFARISGLQDASELDENSFKDDQKSELSETKPEDVQTEVAVQAVAEVPEDQPEQPDTREVIFEEGEQEKIEAEENEEKPTRRRKKKTTDAEDESDSR